MIPGIDVSNNQGAINWGMVASAGKQFAIIKASEGVSFSDSFMPGNVNGCKANGIMPGLYHFASGWPADQEAQHFLDSIAGIWAPGMPVALDIEEWQGNLERMGDVPSWIMQWLRHVESGLGIKPLLYSSPSTIQEHGIGSVPGMGDYGLWLASWGLPHIPTPPSPWEFVAVWQHGVGGAGSVPGVNGGCDLDVFNGEPPWFLAYGIPAEAPAPPPPPPPGPPSPDQLRRLAANLSAAQGILEDAVAQLRAMSGQS